MLGQEQADLRDSATQFLFLCLRSRWDPASLDEARALAARGELDWEAVRQRVRGQGLSPLVYLAVRDQGLLPPPLEQDLRQAYYQAGARNVLLFETLEQVLRCLAAANLPVILLKGAALAEGVYANLALRSMGDLDLLMRPEHVPAALRALAALGYRPVRPETHPGDLLAYENEVALRSSGQAGVALEIHWSLFDSPYHQRKISLDWFWQTARPIQVGQTPALALGPEAQILHLCGHLLLHHGSGGELGAVWLHDVAEVVACYQGQTDWDQVLAQAQACDLVLPVQRVLDRVAQAWRAPAPPDVLERLRALRPSPEEERVLARLTAPSRPVALRFWADLASMAGWPERLRFAWNNLFPSADYMQRRYGIARRLAPLYYPYRWFLGLRSLAKK